MGPLNEPEPSLAEIRQRYPDWCIVAVFAGFEATPHDVTVVRSMFLSGLAEKLAELDE